jgi:peroxiredoxin
MGFQDIPAGPVTELWHAYCLAIAAMGGAYLLAARDVFRHWPIVLMGLGAKLSSAAFTGWDISAGRPTEQAWWIVAVDDLIWLTPLTLILLSAHDALLCRKRTVSPDLLRFALRRRTQYGVSLDEISRLSPVLLVFLRHSGCPFCREALSDLARQRREIEAHGARLVLVHMGTEENSLGFFRKYGLQEVPRLSDPERALYRAFGLKRGSLTDLFGPKVWWRGFQAGILGRHGMGHRVGDAFQMPGVFLLFHGEIVRGFRHQSAADRPDYMALVTGRDYAAPELRDA